MLSEIEAYDGEWLVTWADGTQRKTTLAVLAWYADNFDDDAEVERV